MKGYLNKIEDWFVIYDQRTMQDPSAEDGMLPLHPHDIAVSSFNFYNGKEVQFQIRRYDGTIPILNAWNGYAKLIDYDENGKPLTYWGGLKDRTCDHTNCREVCPECKLHSDILKNVISSQPDWNEEPLNYYGEDFGKDCEAVKNWDSFVEKKNAELEVNQLAEINSELQEATYTLPHKTTYKHGFIDGYNKAKKLFKEELTKAYIDGKCNGMDISHPLSIIKEISFDSWYNDNYETKNGEGTSQPLNF